MIFRALYKCFREFVCAFFFKLQAGPTHQEIPKTFHGHVSLGFLEFAPENLTLGAHQNFGETSIDMFLFFLFRERWLLTDCIVQRSAFIVRTKKKSEGVMNRGIRSFDAHPPSKFQVQPPKNN